MGDKIHPWGTKFALRASGLLPGQLVDRLEALIDGLREERRELLVVEDLQVAARRDFANLKHSKVAKIQMKVFEFSRK
jgi:hypothetical protein